MTRRSINQLLYLSTLCLLLALQSCRSIKQELESGKRQKIVAGVGFGPFKLDYSTKQDAIRELGDNYVDTVFMWPARALIYDQYGLTFCYWENDSIWDIIFYHPFNGITDRGIVLNKSTMEDVRDEYGSVSWWTSYPDEHWGSYYSPGIEYQVYKKWEEGPKDFKVSKFIGQKIYRIEVIRYDTIIVGDTVRQ